MLRNKRLLNPLSRIIIALMVVISMFSTSIPLVFADESNDSPISITVGIWNSSGNCISSTTTVNLKYYNQNTLPNEWYASWPYNSLQAGNVLIKANAYYYYVTGQQWGYVCNGGGSKAYFTIDTAQANYIAGSYSSKCSPYPYCASADDPGTDGLMMLESPDNVNWYYTFYNWGSCVQNETDYLANQGYNRNVILQDIYINGYGGCGNNLFNYLNFLTSDSSYS